MNHNPLVPRLSLSLLFLATLAACGGSNSSNDIIMTTPESTATSGTPSPATTSESSQGVISGFGSIYINGKKYNTDNANIAINGQASSSISNLKVGMKISLTSSSNGNGDNIATSVIYDTEIKGYIQSIDRNNQQILIADTIVQYNDLTHFIDTTETALTVEQFIEVSGYLQADGSFLATYIEQDDSPGSINEYTAGIVSNLNIAEQQFTINNTLIDYANSVLEGVLADNIYVRVKGSFANNVFVATNVDAADESDYYKDDNNNITRYEIEGLVTAISSTSIDVNGRNYIFSSDMTFDAAQLSDIAIGQYVELYIEKESGLVTNIDVDSISAKVDGKTKGRIESIDLPNTSITVSGVIYQFTEQSRFEDDDQQYFNFASLSVDDYVEIVFQQTTPFSILRIEREDQAEYNDEWETKGLVSSIAGNQITVNGIHIELSAAAKYLLNDQLVGQQVFTDALAINTRVEVEGRYDTNDVFTLEKIEIESGHNNDDDASEDDNDNSDDRSDDNKVGYVEIEGRVTSVLSTNSFMLNDLEVRLADNAELEIRDNNADLVTFMASLNVGDSIEIEGQWIDNSYILADEAEIK